MSYLRLLNSDSFEALEGVRNNFKNRNMKESHFTVQYVSAGIFLNYKWKCVILLSFSVDDNV